MTVCRFFQQGNCKFGNNCRNEHPNPNNNRNQTSNRFGALGGGGTNSIADKYSITVDAIERDLTNETPQWILSAYAPGRDAPGQLFGGYPREQSFEELRLHYVMGKASGNEQQALNQAQELWTNAQQQMQNAVRNAQEAVQFIVSAENNHPNRQDICKERTEGAPFGEFIVGKRPKSMLDVFTGQPHNQSSLATSSPFGGGASAGQSAFGQPSALGAKPSPFGAPSFGQPSQPNTQGSAFGQPSQPGQGGSAFGQPSQLGQGGSAFGQPSQPAPAFGQPSQPTSAFGQASQPTSAFGQTSALGAKPSPFGAPSFGQPSQPSAQGSAFGQASQLGQKPNPFGAPTNTNNNASPFGSAGNNNNAPAANPFGAPSGGFANNQNSSPFGSTNNNQPANSGFSSFGKPSQGASPFGQQQNAPAASGGFASANQAPAQNANNPFGQPSQQPQPNGFASQNNQQASNPFGQPSQPNPFGQPSAPPAGANPFASGQPQAPKPAAAASSGGPYPPNSSKQHPPIESYSSKGMDGRLTMFRGKPVTYKDNLPGIRDFDGTWRRIWFPDGPPGYSKDTELPPEQYDDKSKAQWIAFAQKGEFEGGVMPELPPPRECTLWNF